MSAGGESANPAGVMMIIRFLGKNWYKWTPAACLAILLCMVLPICIALAQEFDDPDEAFDEYSDLQEMIETEEKLLADLAQRLGMGVEKLDACLEENLSSGEKNLLSPLLGYMQ